MPGDKLTNVSTFQDRAIGKAIYTKTCLARHRATGLGIPNAFPPLAKSDYLNKDTNRAIKAVMNELHGPITVNDIKINSLCQRKT